MGYLLARLWNSGAVPRLDETQLTSEPLLGHAEYCQEEHVVD